MTASFVVIITKKRDEVVNLTWSELMTQIILSFMGIAVTGVGIILTYVVNKYVKNNELKTIIMSLNSVVHACVREVYQTYVQELKDKNMFDKEAQMKALAMCLDEIKNQIPNNIKEWLDKNFNDVETYLITLIESSVAMWKVSRK